MMSALGLSASDLLFLLTIATILISIVSLLRRNGNGHKSEGGNGNGYGRANGNGSVAADAERISRAWRVLTQEQRREIEIWRELAHLRGEQLAQARIEPATIAQAESIYDTIKDLTKWFSTDELDTLMLAIDIKPDSIGGDTIEERARELVLTADRRGKLVALAPRGD